MGRSRSLSVAVAATVAVSLIVSSAALAAGQSPSIGQARAAAPTVSSPGSLGVIRPTAARTVDVSVLAAHPSAAASTMIHGAPRLSPQGSAGATAPGGPTSTQVPGNPTVSPSGPRVAVLPADLTIATSFAGLGHSCATSTTCTEPPDPTVAVSGSYVVQAVNAGVAIYDRSGKSLKATIPFETFFAEPAGQTGDTDPHILWDAVHGRWLATEASWQCGSSGTGSLYLAVSSGSNPTGTWTSYQFPVSGELTDYPDLATSSDKVAMTANLFALKPSATNCLSNTYDGGLLGAIDWSALTGGNPVLRYDPTAQNGFAWRPASDPATTSTIYAIGEDVSGSNDVLYETVSGTHAAGTLAFHGPFNPTCNPAAPGCPAPFADPPAPEQQGTPSTITGAVDGRPTDAVWRNGHLWFVATAPCTPTGDSQTRDCVRLVQLTTASTSATVRQDFLIADNGFDDFMGGIGLTGVGALVVVYSQSSPTSFVSTYAAVQEPAAAVNTLGTPVQVQAGAGTYTGTRWGDYLELAPDPAEPTALWEAAEYPTASGSWATTVAQLLVPSTYVPLAGPVRILDTRAGTGLSGPFVNHVPRTWQVTGKGGVPTDAVAVTGNLTVTGQGAAGYVSLTTTPQTNPTTSTLNVPLADVRANGVTTPLGAGGSLSATYVGGTGSTGTQLVFDVTGYFLPGTAQATFTALPPARILDTRPAPYNTGLSGPFVNRVPRAFAVAGLGGVPAGALAITGNLTVTGQTAAGYVSLTTAKPASTPTTSTLNFPLADNRANGITMPLSTGASPGQLWATYVGGPASGTATADLILDVTGYYAAGPSGALYVPLTPVRTLDTRAGTGLSGPFVRTVPRTLQVTGRTHVSSTAVGVTGNVTVVGQTAAGYVSITQEPEASPATSTINFPLGDTRANNLTAPLADGTTAPPGGGTPAPKGSLSGTYMGGLGSASTQLVLDLTGFFIPTT